MSRRRPLLPEGSLVAFTLLAQAAAGASFWSLGLRLGGEEPLAFRIDSAAAGLIVCALGVSLLHLGSPGNAWRSARNWRSSWLSREILCGILFAAALLGSVLPAPFGAPPVPRVLLSGLAALWGTCLILVMGRAYTLRTVPAWNHPTTPLSFLLSALLLGTVIATCLAALSPFPDLPGSPWILVLPALAVLGAQIIVQEAAWRRLRGIGGRREMLSRTPSALHAGRMAGAALAAVLLCADLFETRGSGALGSGWLPLSAGVLVAGSEILGRALFYASRERGRM